MNLDWNILLNSLSSAGWLVAAASLYRQICYRKLFRRQEQLKTEREEGTVVQESYNWAKSRLEEKDQKIDELYDERHKLWDEILNKNAEITELKLKNQKLTYERCEIRGCARRQPPSEYMK